LICLQPMGGTARPPQPDSLHSDLIEVLPEKPSWLQKCIKGGKGYSKVLLSTKPPKPSSSAHPEDKNACPL
jgi:hypothetical protein